MKKTYFKKSISLIMTVLMIMSCWVFVAPQKADAADATVNPTALTAIYNGSGSRGDSAKIVICSDGEAGNTTVGHIRFNISGFDSAVANATLTLSTGNHGGTLVSNCRVDVYPLAVNQCQATSGTYLVNNIANVYGGTYNAAAGVSNALNYYGLTTADRLGTVYQNAPGTHTIDVTSAVQKAKSAGQSEVCFLFIMPEIFNDGNGNSWSDTHINVSGTSLSYTKSTFVASDTGVPIVDINTDAVNSVVNLNTNVTTIYGSFESDADYTSTSNYDAVYHNVLYTDGPVTIAASATSAQTEYGSSWTGSNGVTVYWYHPTATLLYDGDTTNLPRLGVAVNTVMYYSGTWSRKTVNRLSYVASGGNGFNFNQNWHGSDGRLNFQYMWHGQNEMMGYTSTIANDAMRQTLSGNSDNHFYANLLKFTDTMGANEYWRSAQPTFGFYGDNGDNGKTITATTTDTLYIINYVPLRTAIEDAITKLAEVKANPGKYTTASVAKLVSAANALVAAKPNNYINATNNDVSGWALAAESAVNSYNNAKLELATYDVGYENLFSFSSWVNSASGVVGTSAKGTMTYDVNAGTITFANNASNTQSNPNDHYSSYGFTNNHYNVNLTPGEEYFFQYTTSGGTGDQVHIFFYDDAGNAVANPANRGSAFANAYGTGHGTSTIYFAAPEGATKAAFRFGTTVLGETVTFSDMRLFTMGRGDEVGIADWTVTPNREVFEYNALLGTKTLAVPERPGYTFNGWWVDSINANGTKDDGEQVSDGEGNVVAGLKNFPITQDWVLYSEWTINKYTVRFVDAKGETVSETEYDYGTPASDIEAPSNTEAFNDVDGHHTFAWPTIEVVTDNVTYTEAESIGAHTTETKEENRVEATCAKDGSYVLVTYCSVCDTEISRENKTITATGAHTWSEATCTAPKTCSVCGATEGEALGHDFSVLVSSTAGDCQTVGTTTYKCSRCDATNVVNGALGEHNYTSVVTNPTCTEDGYTTYTCSICNDTYKDDEVTALGHTPGTAVKENEKEATCTAEGSYVEVVYCSVCNEKLSSNTVTVPKKDHQWSAWAQYQNGDKHTRTCSVCSAYEEGYHSYTTDPKPVTMSGSTAHYHNYKCTLCEARGVMNGSTPMQNIGTACYQGSEATYADNGDGNHTADCVCGNTKTEAHWWSVTDSKDATCTENGYKNSKCNYCSATKEETIPAAHTLDEWVEEVTATCVKEGTKGHYTCSVCGKHFDADENEISDLTIAINNNHVNTENKAKQEPTCTEVGYEAGVYCNDCQTWISGHEEIEAKGHSYSTFAHDEGANTHSKVCSACGDKITEECTAGNWVVSINATCMEKGSQYKACTVCAYVMETEEIPEIPHNYGTEVANKEAGTHYYKCTNLLNSGKYCTEYGNEEACSGGTATCTEKAVCAKCQTAYGDALGHDFSVFVSSTAGDCQTVGTTTYKCSRCDETNVVNGEYGAHSYESKVTAPTCTEDGYTTYTCSICNDTYKDDEVTALGHTWVDATCTAPKTCSVCDATEGEALGHTWTDATCTTPKTCSVCDATEGEALGHNYVLTTGTSNNNGTHTVICDRCAEGTEGHTKVVDCTYGEGVVTAPTCTKDGYTTHTCTACGYSYEDAKTTATGHTFGEWVANNDVHTRICTVCTDEEGRVETGECTYGEWTQTKAPTCTEKGEKAHTCTVCKNTVTEEIAANGHSYTSEVTAPTCETGGFTTHTCSACGNSYVTDTVTALGHAYDETRTEDKLTRPTQKADGTWTNGFYTFVCANDSAHTKTVDVERATYTDYETAVKNLNELLATDITEEAKNAINDVLANNMLAENLIESEQQTVDNATAALTEVFNNYKGSLNTYTVTFIVDGKTVKTETVISGKDAVAPTDIKKASDAENHYTFTAWDKAYTNVTEDITVTAQFSSEAHTFSTHADKDDEYHTDKCSCGYEKDVQHSYDGGVVTTPATCEGKGVKTYTCSVCGGTKTEEIKELGHKYEVTDHKDASCTEDGYDVYTCKNDSKHTYTTVLPKLGHTEETIPAVDATCEDTGLTAGVKCSVCGEILTAQEEVPALGHKWDAATCTTPKTCLVCGKTEGTVGGHTIVTQASKAPTCEEDGFSEGSYCSVCGEIFSAQIEFPATGHIKATRKENIDPATCQKEGYYDLVTYCETCGKVLSTEGKTIGKTEHAAGSEEIIEEVKATCKADGYRIGVTSCSVCGEEISRRTIVLPKLKHSPTETPAVKPTCETTGLTEGTHCEICGTVLTAQKVIPATGHTKETITATIEAATCTKEGVSEITVFCTVCDKTLSVERKPIPMAEHTPADEIREDETPATCGKNGKYTSVINCSVCGAEISRRVVVIPSSGEHDFTIDKGRVEPTCTENGYIAYACTCGAQQKTVLYATGHIDKNGDLVCDDCGAKFDNDCGCLCHKDHWFIRFIYKIVRFFWKLFRVHKECYCTSVHY